MRTADGAYMDNQLIIGWLVLWEQALAAGSGSDTILVILGLYYKIKLEG